jgi:hypothetical protein
MLITDSGLNELTTDLAHLDQVSGKVGFVRWQWEYYRATYDLKIEDSATNSEYFLRINTRVTEGKLEKPDTILKIEAVYIGRATFPHGLEYESPVPDKVMAVANKKLAELKDLLN